MRCNRHERGVEQDLVKTGAVVSYLLALSPSCPLSPWLCSDLPLPTLLSIATPIFPASAEVYKMETELARAGRRRKPDKARRQSVRF